MKVVISGYGRMGRMVESVLLDRGIEIAGKTENVADFDKKTAAGSVCIDFTTPDAFRSNYRCLADNFKAVIVGTTGWYDIKDEVFAYFEKCGTPLIWASNFSVGVNVLNAAVEIASSLLGKAGGYSPYIVEKHHIHKLDAPSGTAVTLSDIIVKRMGIRPEIASVRAGEIPGIHTVSFEGEADRLTFEHEAFSRKGFAEGAVLAATMTEGLTGVHEFRDLFYINDRQYDKR